jgi:hypothetical protein
MDPNAGMEGDGVPSSSATSPAARGHSPVQSRPQPPDENRPVAAVPGQTPGPLLIRLGFVALVLIVVVVLTALGYTAAAAVGLVLGAGLAAVEIINRLK